MWIRKILTQKHVNMASVQNMRSIQIMGHLDGYEKPNSKTVSKGHCCEQIKLRYLP
jgi:hypothetical protein